MLGFCTQPTLKYHPVTQGQLHLLPSVELSLLGALTPVTSSLALVPCPQSSLG